MKVEIASITEKLDNWEESWKKEKECMWQRINVVQKELRYERDEEKKSVNLEGVKVIRRERSGEDEDWNIKMEVLSRRVELMEKEKKKCRIVVRGMSVGWMEGKMKVERLLAGMGVKVNIKRIQGVKDRMDVDKSKLWVVELDNDNEKNEVIRRKRMLKGKPVTIDEDKTWREIRVKWYLLEDKACG